MLKAIRLLNLRRIARQPVRALIASLSISAGVALAAAVLVVGSSLHRSFLDFARSLSGAAPLRVVGPASRGGLDQAVLPIVARTDGVRAASPVVQAVTLANPTHGHGDGIYVVALGFDCSIEALLGKVGCSPALIAGSDEHTPPLVSKRLASRLGAGGVIRTDLGAKRIDSAPMSQSLDSINNGNVVAYPLPAAQALFGRPKSLDAVYVLPQRGVDIGVLQSRLAAAIGPQNSVLRQSDVRPDIGLLVAIFVPILGLISLLALAVGAVLAHNTLTLSLEERRRDLAIATAIGGRPRTIIAGTLAEAGVLGVGGGLIGSGASLLIARPMLGGLEQFISRAGGMQVRIYATLGPFVIGTLIGVATAVVAAIGPARRAGRVDVVAELQQRERLTSIERARSIRRAIVLTVIGVASLGIVRWIGSGNGLEPWQPIVGEVATLVASVTLAWATGSYAPWLFKGASRLFRRKSGPAKLAWANLVRDPRRASVLLIATSLVVGLGFAISSIVMMVTDGIGATNQRETATEVLISTMPTTNNINLDARPSPALLSRLRHFPGVASVGQRVGFGVGTTSKTFIGLTSSEDGAPLPYDVVDGSKDRTVFDRGNALIGPVLARERALRAGSTIPIPGRVGLVRVRVMGVWSDGDFGGRNVWIPPSLVTAIYGPQPPYAYLLRPRAGVYPDALAHDVQAAHLDPFLQAYAPSQILKNVAHDAQMFASPFWALQRGMMLVAFAAVLFTLLLAAAQRRRELGLVAAVGMPPRGLARMVLIETLAVAGVGAVMGTVLGLAIIVAFRDIGFLFLPFRFPFRMDPTGPFVYGAITTVVLLMAAALPAWRNSRLQVVEAIRYE